MTLQHNFIVCSIWHDTTILGYNDYNMTLQYGPYDTTLQYNDTMITTWHYLLLLMTLWQDDDDMTLQYVKDMTLQHDTMKCSSDTILMTLQHDMTLQYLQYDTDMMLHYDIIIRIWHNNMIWQHMAWNWYDTTMSQDGTHDTALKHDNTIVRYDIMTWHGMTT